MFLRLKENKMRVFIGSFLQPTEGFTHVFDTLCETFQSTDSRVQVKWVEPQILHVTVAFIGNINSLQVEQLKKIVCDTCGKFQNGFDVEINGIEVGFGRIPRVIFVRFTSKEFVKMQEELSHNLSNKGFQTEQRPFQTHLTLGRIKYAPLGWHLDSAGLSKAPGFGKIMGNKEHLMKPELIQSKLTSSGPAYEIVS